MLRSRTCCGDDSRAGGYGTGLEGGWRFAVASVRVRSAISAIAADAVLGTREAVGASRLLSCGSEPTPLLRLLRCFSAAASRFAAPGRSNGGWRFAGAVVRVRAELACCGYASRFQEGRKAIGASRWRWRCRSDRQSPLPLRMPYSARGRWCASDSISADIILSGMAATRLRAVPKVARYALFS